MHIKRSVYQNQNNILKIYFSYYAAFSTFVRIQGEHFLTAEFGIFVLLRRRYSQKYK